MAYCTPNNEGQKEQSCQDGRKRHSSLLQLKLLMLLLAVPFQEAPDSCSGGEARREAPESRHNGVWTLRGTDLAQPSHHLVAHQTT